MQEGDIRRESAVGVGKSDKNGDEAGLFHLQQDIQIEGSAGSKRANGNREKAPRRGRGVANKETKGTIDREMGDYRSMYEERRRRERRI